MTTINLIGGGEIKDYAHASKVFRPNGFARAGKYKFLFHVFFNVNPNVVAPNGPVSNVDKRELSYFVKKAELPKFTVDTQVMNQYNRKQITQKKINYQPVNITFHDDNGNQIRELWRNYYNFYYADGRYAETLYQKSDRYAVGDTRLQNNWGFNPTNNQPFFTSIDIYSLYAGKSFKVSLLNPLITSFNHDAHDYASVSDLMEHTMQISYTGVKYLEGYWTGTEGFADQSGYDRSPSSQTPTTAGQVYDPKSGTTITPGDKFVDNSIANNPISEIKQTQIAAGTANPNSTAASKIDTASMLVSQSKNQGPLVFPTVGINNGTSSTTTDPGAVSLNQTTQAVSEQTVLKDINQNFGVYASGSWQSSLEQRGYSAANITSAQNTVNAGIASGAIANNGQAIAFAIKYLNNPQSTSSIQAPVFTDPASNYAVSFSNSNAVQPVYNAQSWQQALLNKGYQSYEVAQADNNLSNVRLSPDVNVQIYAENYIKRLHRGSVVK